MRATKTPVRRIEARRDHLRQLANRAETPAEREVAESELATVVGQLHAARREKLLQDTFDRYLPTDIDAARATRTGTLAHDALTAQPKWMIEHVRHLHDNHQLSRCDVHDVATWITEAAASFDLNGQLPPQWPERASIAVDTPALEVELG